MRPSPYDLERELGISWYASESDGIGGRLRTIPEDFCVNEIPCEGNGGNTGPYLICRLTKKNWELQHAVREIAKKIGISHRRIGWAGTKDRNAVTTQWISLYHVSPEQVSAVHLKDIQLDPVGWSNEALALGDLQGNRFAIVIREVDREGLPARIIPISRVVETGIPNYFGIQRFGAIRPVTHRVGEWILRGDYEEAVLTYIAMEFPGEPEKIRSVRAAFRATRDPVPALRDMPVQMNYERAMLHYLCAHPGDYGGALRELPPKLLSMFVSAYQSFLFNLALSRRIDDGGGLDEPSCGDLLLFQNGRTDIVSMMNARAAGLHIKRGRCSIALFMPGKERRPSAVGGAADILLEESGLSHDHFARASAFVKTKFDGACRPIALKTDVAVTDQDAGLGLAFSLGPGQYATTVCREFMKADPGRMV